MSVLLTNSEKILEKREKLVANLFLQSYTNPILSSTNLHIIKSKRGLGAEFCVLVCLSVQFCARCDWPAERGRGDNGLPPLHNSHGQSRMRWLVHAVTFLLVPEIGSKKGPFP